MQAHDKDAFTEALELCFANYREPAPFDGVIDDWMKHLAPYDLMQVGNALEHHKRNCRIVPTIAHVLDLLPKDPTDWPISSVAFGEMIQLEGGRDLLTTKEHLAAFEAARPLLEARDRFNASRAFEDRYDALVTAARNAGARATWFAPPVAGDVDGLRRREALRDGVRTGRISREEGVKAAALLPPPVNGKIPEYDADGNLMALPAPQVSGVARIEADKVYEHMKASYDVNPDRDMDPNIAASRNAAAEQARRVSEYQEAQALKAQLAERDAEIAALKAQLAGKAA
jgi:hypothetical protein